MISEFYYGVLFVNIFIEVIFLEKYFYFDENISAVCDTQMINGTTQKLWQSFSFKLSALKLCEGDSNTFIIGDPIKTVLPEDKEYAITVNEKGICIIGKDYNSLMRGFFVLLMQIQLESANGKRILKIPYFEQTDEYVLKNRMIHICVFPEHDLYYIKKLIRLSALCQYTHIVIEFWGMIEYNCLKELAWPGAFSQEQVKEIVAEAKELGIKLIPIFNMFGHATASRLLIGKHVVLDQNPLLEHLFTPDGWAWDITSDEVYDLLTQIRKELYNLFGDTEYFHIGCDEAYYYTKCDELRAYLPDFIKRLTNDVVKEGYRPMMWMDMILERSKFPKGYYAFGKDGEADILLKSLAPETVMVDWQYNVTEAPIQSSLYLKEKDSDKDLIIAPWYKDGNYNACIETARENDMFGIMLTTWHTLKDYMQTILTCAIKCGAKTLYWSDMNIDMQRTETATLLRRVSFEGNNYLDSGWSKNQINI